MLGAEIMSTSYLASILHSSFIYLYNVQVINDTPAAKGGLKIGDQIIRINDQSAGKKNKDVVSRLRGPIGSEVTITVFRPSAERSLDILLEREHIIPSTVTARFQDKVLSLRITNFNQSERFAN